MRVDFSLLNIVIVIGLIALNFPPHFMSFKKLNIHSLLSFSAGIAIAYVIVHLLPSLAEGQEILNAYFKWHQGINHRYMIYVIAWIGFIAFYIVHAVNFIPKGGQSSFSHEQLHKIDFWYDTSFFIIYNFMIGYLSSVKEFENILQSAVYFVAIGLHIFMNSCNLKCHHGNLYDKLGDYLLAGSMLLGSLLGFFIEMPEFTVSIFEALVTGAMLLNTIKYEMPSDKKGSVRFFILGSVLATALFLLI